MLLGTGAAAATYGLTVAEDKGGWIANLHSFPSTMAQNFWIAIAAWTTCFVVTIAVSLATKARPESELRGLVYGLTELPSEEGISWYRRPVPLALMVCVALAGLNLLFL